MALEQPILACTFLLHFYGYFAAAQYYCKPEARECYPCAPKCSPTVQQFGTEDSCRQQCPSGPHCFVCEKGGCEPHYAHEECTLKKQTHSVFDSEELCTLRCEHEERMQADPRKNRNRNKNREKESESDEEDDDEDEEDDNKTSIGTRSHIGATWTLGVVAGVTLAGFALPAL